MLKLMALTSLIVLLNSQLMASSHIGLKTAFDEMNYVLTVETDGKSLETQAKASANFLKTINDLSVDHSELIEFVVSEIKDEKVALDIKAALSILAISQVDQQTALNYVSSTLQKTYQLGASWNGKIDRKLQIGALIVIMAAALTMSSGGNSSGEGFTCSDTSYYCSVNCQTFGDGCTSNGL